MNNTFEEGNLRFDFSDCGIAERFDDTQINPRGLKAVDFVVESANRLYFIEVKDFQNPNAPKEQREQDYKLLVEAGTGKKKRTLLNPDQEEAYAVFNLEMGEKIKDSLLRKYSLGDEFTKDVAYVLVIHLNALTAYERGRLKEKISGHVPTGLNKPHFKKFTELSFDLVDVGQLRRYGIKCVEISRANAKD
jgi:hypothetical protein